MAKIVLSPLAATLVVLWVVNIYLLCRWRRLDRGLRSACVIVVIILSALTLASMPGVSKLIYLTLIDEAFYEARCPLDAIVVLGGGYVPGPNPEMDSLSGESALRVIDGTRLYKQCNPKWLIFNGRSKSGKKKRHGELMRELAIDMGVPKERILIETDSVNTREHPIYLEAMGLFDRNADIAIVTSPWHLKRALIEFRRKYPLTKGVAAYSEFPGSRASYKGWPLELPRIEVLALTTSMIHEYIGMVWYSIKDWLSR